MGVKGTTWKKKERSYASRLLRAEMAINNDTYETLAAALGIASQTCCNKVNDKSAFNPREVYIISQRYGLDENEQFKIFGYAAKFNDKALDFDMRRRNEEIG